MDSQEIHLTFRYSKRVSTLLYCFTSYNVTESRKFISHHSLYPNRILLFQEECLALDEICHPLRMSAIIFFFGKLFAFHDGSFSMQLNKVESVYLVLNADHLQRIGLGKTAILRGLAEHITSEEVPV